MNLKQSKLKVQCVSVGEDTFHVRQINGHERAALLDRIKGADENLSNIWMIIFTVCDELGKLLYGVDDFETLCEVVPCAISDALGSAALALNKWDKPSEEEAKKK